MTVEDIIRGESKKVEFKQELPKKSEKYIKTVVAYANTQGGKLLFGVVDDTREIIGIDESILFQTMDSIASAISDSCEPQIIPEIEPYTIDGKTIIVVTVSPEPHRPYFLKAKGKMNGTYVRVAGTTRIASPEKIKELEMEGAKISWDELACVGYTVTENAIKKLCRDMNTRRKAMQEQKNKNEKLPAVTRTNLENWKVLRKNSDRYIASNAFVLLTSDFFQFSKTQCAVFKGTDRSVFLDKRTYDGPLYEQIDEAVNFVLRNIRLGARIDGVQRKEFYELPVEAIREMIINAHCHRLMTEESCIQVAIYDDRLEVTSPGGLYNGLTFEEALQGHSKLRNRAIANIFSQIGLIEAWGTGLQRIQSSARAYGLPEPEFIEMPESFRVNLFRQALPTEKQSANGEKLKEHQSDVGKMSEERRKNVGKMSEENNIYDPRLNPLQNKIIEMLLLDPHMTAIKLAEEIGISSRGIERNIKILKEQNILIRRGSNKGGYWEVIQVK